MLFSYLSILGLISGLAATIATTGGAEPTSPAKTTTVQSPANMNVTFSADAWQGMGKVALIVEPPSSGFTMSGLLYVLSSVKADSSADTPAKAVLLSDHALSAQFSPDGKWVAVVTQSETGDKANPTFKTALWLMSTDGSIRQKVSQTAVSSGSWIPGTDTYMYKVGGAKIYSINPGSAPTEVPLHLPQGVTVSAFEPSPTGSNIAIDEVVPAADGEVMDRHDAIALWNPKTGKTRPLLTAPKMDGFKLGPWTDDGTQLFYWPNPMHSGSLAADGLSLHRLNISSGKAQSIATTLTGSGAVIPYGKNQAVVQTGGGRYLFQQKKVALWNGENLQPLQQSTQKKASAQSSTTASNSVSELWPVSSPDGTAVAFAQAPAMSAPTSKQAQSWWKQLQLVTVQFKTGDRTVLRNAGEGVESPHYAENGQRIFFLKNGALDWVSADGEGAIHSVLEVSPTKAQTYPQWGMPQPLRIADYWS